MLPENLAELATDSLLKRELDSPTTIGHAAAIPHAYIDGIEEQIVLFVRLAHPINLGAPDGIATHFLFFLPGPPNAAADHLDTLAGIARLMSDSEFLADFGPAIALAAMTAVAIWLHEVSLKVLPVPDSFGTTSGRSWSVDLFALPLWARFAAIASAIKDNTDGGPVRTVPFHGSCLDIRKPIPGATRFVGERPVALSRDALSYVAFLVGRSTRSRCYNSFAWACCGSSKAARSGSCFQSSSHYWYRFDCWQESTLRPNIWSHLTPMKHQTKSKHTGLSNEAD